MYTILTIIRCPSHLLHLCEQNGFLFYQNYKTTFKNRKKGFLALEILCSKGVLGFKARVIQSMYAQNYVPHLTTISRKSDERCSPCHAHVQPSFFVEKKINSNNHKTVSVKDRQTNRKKQSRFETTQFRQVSTAQYSTWYTIAEEPCSKLKLATQRTDKLESIDRFLGIKNRQDDRRLW